ncbi:MAG: hypothetical protein AAF959_19440 [Cyanobacteria bacterium P01_D01_bin.56]
MNNIPESIRAVLMSSKEDTELSRFREYRWWPISEVKGSPDRFVAAKLGDPFKDLHANGPSTNVIETGE